MTLIKFITIQLFLIVPPGTYNCWVEGQRQHEMRCLLGTFKHDQEWESNTRPFDLESLVLSTGSHTTDGHTQKWLIQENKGGQRMNYSHSIIQSNAYSMLFWSSSITSQSKENRGHSQSIKSVKIHIESEGCVKLKINIATDDIQRHLMK